MTLREGINKLEDASYIRRPLQNNSELGGRVNIWYINIRIIDKKSSNVYCYGVPSCRNGL